jgi:hypothetical protein
MLTTPNCFLLLFLTDNLIDHGYLLMIALAVAWQVIIAAEHTDMP